MQSELPKNIFRSYDIRGVYPTELNEQVAELIGKAFGTFLAKKHLKTVVVGRDDRESSPVLLESLVKGLVSAGCFVTNVGITLTPIIHFLTCVKKFDLGINVTASHNPKEYNGFRIDYANAKGFYGDDILEIYNIAQSGEFVSKTGASLHENLADLYIDYFLKHFSIDRRYKVILDCGNGASSVIAPKLLTELGCEVVPMFCEYDAAFPHGVPDPENPMIIDQLAKEVVNKKADIGFSFDTDGDRLGVVDEKGNTYEMDKLLLLFAEYLLQKRPGATVVYDVKSSSMLEELIKAFGGVPKMIKTGHPFFMEEIKKGAMLGCEFSGHVFYADDYFGFDDGLFGACKILEILNKSSRPLSELMNRYPKSFHTHEIKINCGNDTNKFETKERIKLKALVPGKYVRVIDIDGIRVNVSKTGWFLVRASNTTPVLSTRAEGIEKKDLEVVLTSLRDLLKEVGMENVKELEKVDVVIS